GYQVASTPTAPLWYNFRLLGSCPSGQWEQTVNLPANAYVGSNPSLPTISALVAQRQSTSLVKKRSRVRFSSRAPAISQIVSQISGYLRPSWVLSRGRVGQELS